MTGSERDLTKYGVKVTESVPPLVHRKIIVWSPTADYKPTGFAGYDRRREHRVYSTRRKQYHFYRSGEGYAISDKILEQLRGRDVARIVVHTADGKDVYEFATRQYLGGGEPVPDSDLLDKRDPQTYVPVSEAMHHWDRESNPNDLFVESFDEAMDRIIDKRGWDHGWRPR